MFGIGMTELMVIFVIALLVLGPKRLPGLARSLGKGLAEFRRASTDMRREFLDVAEEVRIDPRSFAPESDEEPEATPEPAEPAAESGAMAPSAGAESEDRPRPAGAEPEDRPRPAGTRGDD